MYHRSTSPRLRTPPLWPPPPSASTWTRRGWCDALSGCKRQRQKRYPASACARPAQSQVQARGSPACELTAQPCLGDPKSLAPLPSTRPPACPPTRPPRTLPHALPPALPRAQQPALLPRARNTPARPGRSSPPCCGTWPAAGAAPGRGGCRARPACHCPRPPGHRATASVAEGITSRRGGGEGKWC